MSQVTEYNNADRYVALRSAILGDENSPLAELMKSRSQPTNAEEFDKVMDEATHLYQQLQE